MHLSFSEKFSFRVLAMRLFVFTLGYLLFSQQAVVIGQKVIPDVNKNPLDAGFRMGVAFPLDDHRSGKIKIVVPTQAALTGIALALEAHVGIANGWKFGFDLQSIVCNLDELTLTDFVMSTLDTSGFMTVSDPDDGGSYSSRVFYTGIEKDITVDNWRVAPHVSLGLTSLQTVFNCEFSQVRSVDDYRRTINVNANELSSLDVVFATGVKAGYIIPWMDSKLFLHVTGEYMQYRSTMGLEFSIADNAGNETYTQQWYSGNVRNFSLMFGGTYYLQ